MFSISNVLPVAIFAPTLTERSPLIDQTPILNNDELMLIRAALRFWQDEMSPHDLGLAASYFAAGKSDSLPLDVGMEQLLNRLEACHLRYVIYDPDHEMILHSRLFESAEVAKQNCADHVAIATTLVIA